MIFNDTVNQTALIVQIQEARETLEELLTLLQSAPVERDRFVSHFYQARREYRGTCETAGKSGKQIERCVMLTFQIARSMGFKGDFRQWEHLLGWEIENRRGVNLESSETLLPVAPVLGIRRSVAPGFCGAIFLDPQSKKAPNCRGSDEKDLLRFTRKNGKRCAEKTTASC